MDEPVLQQALELSRQRKAFALATVFAMEGSGSARPGAKILIDDSGQVVSGWIGGGCAESTVREEALLSLKDGEVRTITLDLTDEFGALGMPCGGKMHVYIEPMLPKPDLVIAGHGRIVEVLAELGHLLGFSVTVADPAADPERLAAETTVVQGWLSTVNLPPGAYVVVATHHKADHLALKQALDQQASYVALIASRTRAQLVLEYVAAAGVSPADLQRIRTPAGLDLGAETPEEIALSIMSEIIALRRGGNGKPMTVAASAVGIPSGQDLAACESKA